MTFPQTRHTLIERIALHGDEEAWRQFLSDYWGPIWRFAAARGHLALADAEDLAGDVFLVLVRNRLLARWASQPAARLRTLLCTVVRNLQANRQRVERGRQKHEAALLLTALPGQAIEEDAFHAAWVEDLLQRAVDGLMNDLHARGQGDDFRVLFGRLCEGMTAAEVAEALAVTLSQSEEAYKRARRLLAARLESLVREHVSRYCPAQDVDGEFE